MGTARRIYKNTLYLGSAEVISKILQFAVMLYAARLLSKDSFGKFSFALSLSFIALVMADMGINTLLVREISRDKSKAGKHIVNAFSLKLVLSAIVFVFITIFLNAFNYPQETKSVTYIVWAFTILSTFTDLFYSVFRAFEMMFYDAFLKILRMAILAISSLYVLLMGYGLFAFSYTFVMTEIIIVIIAFLIAWNKFLKLKFSKVASLIDFKFCTTIFRKALPFGLAVVFGSIYFYIGSVMLSKIRGDAEVAIYSVAYNLALAILFIPTVYTNAIYPVLSRCYRESKTSLRLMYEKSFKYLYIIGLPISVGLYVLSGRIILFLYGKPYSGASVALQIISWYLFLKFINFLLGIVLSSIDQQGKRMNGQAMTALFNVALNFYLIPKIGYAGAAWATLFTEIVLFVLYYWFVSKSLYFFNFSRILAKPIIAAFAMFLLIKLTHFGLIATILLSALAYFIALFILKAFDKEDYGILRKILKNESVQAD